MILLSPKLNRAHNYNNLKRTKAIGSLVIAKTKIAKNTNRAMGNKHFVDCFL